MISKSLEIFPRMFVFTYKYPNNKDKELRRRFRNLGSFFFGTRKLINMLFSTLKTGINRFTGALDLLKGNFALFLTTMTNLEVNKLLEEFEFADFACEGDQVNSSYELSSGP